MADLVFNNYDSSWNNGFSEHAAIVFEPVGNLVTGHISVVKIPTQVNLGIFCCCNGARKKSK